MSNRNFWIAFFTGITAGAVVALLYAPQDGKATRKKIGRAYDDAEDYIEDAGDYLKDQAERLSKEAAYAYKKGKKQIDEAYSKASDALTDAYGDAKDKLTDVAETANKKARSLV